MALETEPTMTPSDWEIAELIARSPERPEIWPKGVYSISFKGLALLGVDSQNRLYWNGQRIPNLVLSRWQKAGAFVIAGSALITAIAASVSAYADIT